jgi:DNA-directed RNA polymerase subunit RPC12/RpoP
MTELKCHNCRETFGLPAAGTTAVARFCPYCGSTSLAIVIKEGPTVFSGSTAFTPEPSLPDPSEDLVEEEEKPRRSRKR